MSKHKDYKKLILERLHTGVDQYHKKSHDNSVKTQSTPNEPKTNLKQKQLRHFFDDFQSNCAVYCQTPIQSHSKIAVRRNLYYELIQAYKANDNSKMKKRNIEFTYQISEFKLNQKNKTSLGSMRMKQSRQNHKDIYTRRNEIKPVSKPQIPHSLSRHRSLKAIETIPSIKRISTISDYDSCRYQGFKPTSSILNSNDIYNSNKRNQKITKIEIKMDKKVNPYRKLVPPQLRRCQSFKK